MSVYLHAGTHKTGSKSLQALLRDCRQELLAIGYDLYHGRHGNGTNHTELQLATMRRDRDSFARTIWPKLVVDDAYFDAVRESVGSFLERSAVPHQILTNEDLSYLRHPDEFERLADLLGFPQREIKVIVVVRERASFLRSYTTQIFKRPNRAPSNDPTSALYVGADSWLCDTDSLIKAFAHQFSEPPTVICYEDAMRSDGSSIPSVLAAMDIDPECLPWKRYFLNPSSHEQPSEISHVARRHLA